MNQDTKTQLREDAEFLREAVKALRDTPPGETPLEPADVQWFAYLLLYQHKNPTKEPWE